MVVESLVFTAFLLVGHIARCRVVCKKQAAAVMQKEDGISSDEAGNINRLATVTRQMGSNHDGGIVRCVSFPLSWLEPVAF